MGSATTARTSSGGANASYLPISTRVGVSSGAPDGCVVPVTPHAVQGLALRSGRPGRWGSSGTERLPRPRAGAPAQFGR